MPHTSRRKKHVPTKRLEVTDDDGWTRVTTNNRERRGLRAIGNVSSGSGSFWQTTPEEGASAEKIRQEYERTQEQWKASDSCRALVSLLQEKVLPENVEIDRCFIFGSGSFCGLRQGWISRKHSALCQLAVLKSIRGTIGESRRRSIAVTCANTIQKKPQPERYQSMFKTPPTTMLTLVSCTTSVRTWQRHQRALTWSRARVWCTHRMQNITWKCKC